MSRIVGTLHQLLKVLLKFSAWRLIASSRSSLNAISSFRVVCCQCSGTAHITEVVNNFAADSMKNSHRVLANVIRL